ncbi:hypothetical protein IC582_020033 [Cucumis melo]
MAWEVVPPSSLGKKKREEILTLIPLPPLPPSLPPLCSSSAVAPTRTRVSPRRAANPSRLRLSSSPSSHRLPSVVVLRQRLSKLGPASHFDHVGRYPSAFVRTSQVAGAAASSRKESRAVLAPRDPSRLPRSDPSP